MYEKLKEYITNGYYTIVQCQNILNNMYAQKQLSDDEYNELFEMSKGLEPNNPDDALEARFSAIDERFKVLEEAFANMKKAFEESGQSVPDVNQPDGSEFNPITAYSGLYYKRKLYYLDPTNNEVYQCRDREDIDPDKGVLLYDMPSKLVNIFFDWVRKA